MALFTIHGYSKIMKTANVCRKIFCLLCLIILLSTLVYYIVITLQNYYQYDVVTQIKIKEAEIMTFPAITLCPVIYNYSVSLNQRPYIFEEFGSNHLRNIFLECKFEGRECSIDDFENFTQYWQYEQTGISLNCYKFNGKVKFQSKKFGSYSGLILYFNLAIKDFILYHIGENSIRPLASELAQNSLNPGKIYLQRIEKSTDNKLPNPYSSCSNDINSKTSPLVKRILDQNITYRKVNCYDLCLNEYAEVLNISMQARYNMIFDYQGNCSQNCPLECESSFFELKSDVQFLDENVNNSKNFLWVNFFYSDNLYTEIAQSVKTTPADLISNAGGLLGLFLDLSFMSIYRLIAVAFRFDFA